MCRLDKFLVPAWRRVLGIGILVSASLSAGVALGQPANDNFSSPTDLNAFDTGAGVGTNADDNTGATLQSGEPMILTNTGGASLWYNWTAPVDGLVTFRTTNAAFQTLLGVYTGNNISNLNLVAADNGSHAGNSAVTFVAVAGTVFDITVDGNLGAQGPFKLVWKTVAPTKAPTNDIFTNATVITGSSGTIFGDNFFATLQNKEPQAVPGTTGGASIWYTWSAPGSGIATINTAGSTFDTVLGVFIKGNNGTNLSVTNLTRVADNDDFMGRRTSQVSFPVSAGTTYKIDIDGFNGAMGFVQLNWNLAPLPPNDNFANATFLGSQTSGSISDNNLGATAEGGEPSHAGFPATSSLWYTWTAPESGDVEVDTIGSSIDTVVAVYGGTTLSSLTQLAANDDLFPTVPLPGRGPSQGQVNEAVENFSFTTLPNTPLNLPWDPNYGILDTNQPPVLNFSGEFRGNTVSFDQPYSGLLINGTYGSGASGLHFTAVAGVTYHIAVDGKFGSQGPIMLNWACHPSGVFRWATEIRDFTSGVPAKGGDPGMLLYQVSETEFDERTSGTVNAGQYKTTHRTAYTYDAPYLLVTVTRVAGSSGRVTVGYGLVDGDQLSDHYSFDGNTGTLVSDGIPIPLGGDAPALFGTDYALGGTGGKIGTLTFDDFEMSKTIAIAIGDSVQVAEPNRDFGLVLFDPQIDATETGDISQPRVDPIFSQALVRILDTDIDPTGPSGIALIATNTSTIGMDTNGNPITTNMVVTNTFWTLGPTNPVFNFTKSYYRVPEDVTNFFSGTPITVYVNRSGTNTGSATVFYRINNIYPDQPPTLDQQNEEFPLEPGSDYAIPNPPGSVGGILGGTPADFDGTASGSLSFPAGPGAFNPQPITFTVFNNSLTEFNRDFRIDLYEVDSKGNSYQAGMVAEATVTILFDDANAPAGSVDEVYNPDYGLDLVEPAGPLGGQPLDTPGTDPQGQVNAVVVQPNGETMIGGAFATYDTTTRGGIALVDANGLLDSSFDPGEGISTGTGDFISSLALEPNGQILAAGSFTSYNGSSVGNIARINTNGVLDTAFQTASGAGANGIVRSLVLNQDGTILIGGDFTMYNGLPRNHVARLNPNGSLDATFDPGNALNGSVYAVASSPGAVILTSTNGNQLENDSPVFNVGTGPGTVTLQYDMIQGSNILDVFYGGGVIFEASKAVSSNTIETAVIPFSGGSSTIQIVMNRGNVTNGPSLWEYQARIQSSITPQIIVGGDFTAAGGIFGQDHIARLLTNGAVDTSFDPGSGANARVYALSIQDTNGQILAGGDFTMVNGQSVDHFIRLNTDGSVDLQYFSGSGTDGSVYHINWVTNAFNVLTNIPGQNVTNNFAPARVYIGGNFTEYNGTHRLGFARLYVDGSLDTTFLDTAYNQFAGLTRIHFSDTPNAVFSSCLQSDGNIIIGGSFQQVGGGQFDSLVRPDSTDPNQWPEPKTRDGVRNRSNVARLIGGSTLGPGNLGLLFTNYPATKSQGTNYVLLTRTNGTLGYASANFSVLPGSAQPTIDYNYDASPPIYPIDWEYLDPSRRHSDGLWGTNTVMNTIFPSVWSYGFEGPSSVLVTINNDTSTSGNVAASFQLANPIGVDQFYLGGQDIPVGLALGRSVAPLSITDDNKNPGSFGFSSPTYSGFGSVPITVIRTNGAANSNPIQISYATSSGSNTTSGVDYVGTAGTLTFNNGDTNKVFDVQVIQSNYISSIEKSVILSLFNYPAGVPQGLTNAVLRIINPNFQGFLNFSATNYVTNLSAGAIQFTVTRTVGSKGTLDVFYATTNGTAMANTNYVGATNKLHWDDGDISSRTVSITLLNGGAVGGSTYFGAYLYNPTLNGSSQPSLLGAITNTTLVINNDNSYGTFEFSAPSYVVNEASNGMATVTVIRTLSALGSATVSFTTANGTAFAGVNYIATNGTLTFAQGQTAATFGVRILNDGVTNVYPFFFGVSLSSPSLGASIGSPNNVPVNIVDAQSFNRPPGSGDVTFNQQGINGTVQAIALQANGQIIAGGNFTSVGGLPRSHYVRLNTDGTLDTSFLNNLSGADRAVSAAAVQSDGAILLGGAFGQIDGIVRNRIARVQVDGSLDTSFNPGAGADNSVFTIAETFINGAREIYVGGAFTTLNADGIPGIGRLNENGTPDGSFTSTGVNGTVNAVAVYATNSVLAGKVLIAGNFTTVNGVNETNVARLNVDGSLDTNFNAGADAAVRAIAIQNDDEIVIGGDFTNVDGNVAPRLARLNTDGSFDNAFATNAAPGPSDSVNAIALQADNGILVAGQFTSANGIPRNHITRLLPSGAVDPTINFGDGANGLIDAMVVQPVDQMILIGGAFTQYNDQSAPYLTRIYGGSATDSGAFRFTAAAYQVNEDGVQAAITIRRTGGTSGPNPDGSGNVSVQFSTSPGSAVPGVNYTPILTNVPFPPAYTLETVFLPVIDDMVVTTNKTVNLVLSSPSAPAALGDQTNAVLTIVNTDTSISFTSGTFTVAKNDPTGFATITLVRNGGGDNTATVDFATTTNGSSAVAGTDYTPTNVTVTFNPGDTNKFVQVAITNNNLPEGDKTVQMVMSNVVNSVLAAPSNAVLTIKDTTFAPGQLFFASTNFFANESAGTALIPVIRTNGSSGSISAFYYTIPGTAQPGVNYTTVSNTITFSDGQTSNVFSVQLVNNNLPQGPVSLTVALATNTSSGTTLLYPSNALLTIINDVNSGVYFSNATNSVLETTTLIALPVNRVGPTNSTARVGYFTADGTAKAGVNYSATSGTLTFSPGQTLKTIDVPITDDPQVTGNLQFSLILTNPSTGVRLVYPSTNYVIVDDADAGISFTNATMNVRRDAGSALVTVITTNPAVEPPILNTNTVPMSVQFTTSDGTALAGLDYIKTSGTLVFTNGNGTNFFRVPIINNSETGVRTFNVSLFNPTAPGQLVAPSNQAISIIDGTAGFKFSSTRYSVNKTDGIATITVYRSGLTDSVATVNFMATNGTAIAGVHYYPTNGTLLFTNGMTNANFGVQVIDTSVVQPNETVLLELFSPSNGILSTPSASTLTIKDPTGSFVVPAGSQITSESIPDGVIDPNETVTVLFAFRDAGGLNVNNLIATLIATNGVTSPSPSSQIYGPLIASGHSVSQPFTFTAVGTNGQQIQATFLLQDGTTNIGTGIFGYVLGSSTYRFTNGAFITINDNDVATPYPSTIGVSNLVGSVLKATITLTNLQHTSPHDIDALLVSPAEQTALFMAHVGGQNAITNVDLTFDDAASNYLSEFGQIISGTNKPSAVLPVPTFP